MRATATLSSQSLAWRRVAWRGNTRVKRRAYAPASPGVEMVVVILPRQDRRPRTTWWRRRLSVQKKTQAMQGWQKKRKDGFSWGSSRHRGLAASPVRMGAKTAYHAIAGAYWCERLGVSVRQGSQLEGCGVRLTVTVKSLSSLTAMRSLAFDKRCP